MGRGGGNTVRDGVIGALAGLVSATNGLEACKESLSHQWPFQIFGPAKRPGSRSNLEWPESAKFTELEYAKVRELLRPGRRARDEARGHIRTLLALESHVHDEVEVSEKDIGRIERGIRAGKEMGDVFPRLGTLATEMVGEGIEVKVHFTKKEGAPVRFVSGDDVEEVATVRERDLQKKYYMQATELANRLALSAPKAAALRKHVGIDGDRQCVHIFEFGKTRIACYSDNALRKMKEALDNESIDHIWETHRPRARRGVAARVLA